MDKSELSELRKQLNTAIAEVERLAALIKPGCLVSFDFFDKDLTPYRDMLFDIDDVTTKKG